MERTTDARHRLPGRMRCSQTAQDHERKGNKGQQGNIVGDEHASKKAQPDQYQCQLKGAVGAGQQCPAQSIKKPCRRSPAMTVIREKRIASVRRSM